MQSVTGRMQGYVSALTVFLDASCVGQLARVSMLDRCTTERLWATGITQVASRSNPLHCIEALRCKTHLIHHAFCEAYALLHIRDFMDHNSFCCVAFPVSIGSMSSHVFHVQKCDDGRIFRLLWMDFTLPVKQLFAESVKKAFASIQTTSSASRSGVGFLYDDYQYKTITHDGCQPLFQLLLHHGHEWTKLQVAREYHDCTQEWERLWKQTGVQATSLPRQA
jgi:hypothetical protein